MRHLATILGMLAACALLTVATLANARPGGGSSFKSSSSSSSSSTSSSSSSSGGSSSGPSQSTSSSSSSSGIFPPSTPSARPVSDDPPPSGGGTIVVIVLSLPVLASFALYVHQLREVKMKEWEAAATVKKEAAMRANRHDSVEAALAAIRSTDDAFSRVLFEDFLIALYVEVHLHRGRSELDRLSAYLSKEARGVLKAYVVTAVKAIAVGGLRIEAAYSDPTSVTVEVVFTSAMEDEYQGHWRRFYWQDHWTLRRSAAARSRAPERARIIVPPPGDADWYVHAVEVRSRTERGPLLTGATEEGTDLPTIVAGDARPMVGALCQRDSSFKWPAFVQRVEQAFHALHRCWSAQDLEAARPHLSDRFYEQQVYWLNAYRVERLKRRRLRRQPETAPLFRILDVRPRLRREREERMGSCPRRAGRSVRSRRLTHELETKP